MSEIAHRVHRQWPLVSGLAVLLLAVTLGLVISLRGNGALGIDAEWMDEIVEHRSGLWDAPSLVMNFLGGGWFVWTVLAAITVTFLALRRPWTAVYFALASLLSSVLVHVLKASFGRLRPEQIFISLDSGSFPSGHVAAAATLAAALAIILWHRWVFVAGTVYVVLRALSRTYLGAHWLSDTIGGLLVGVATAIIVWAPLALWVQIEAKRTSVGA